MYLQANYTVGKGLTDYIGGQGMYNDYRDNRNRWLDKSLQSYDQTHVINASGIYELPFGRGRRWGAGWHSIVDALLGGWQLNGIFQFATGRPLTIDTRRYNLTYRHSDDRWSDDSTADFAGTDFSLTAKVIKTGSGVVGLTEEEKALFSNPPAGSPGGTAQYGFRRPRYSNIDASLFKSFRLPWLGEQGRILFRAEFFNLLNHPTFSYVVDNNINRCRYNCINSGAFGNITSMNGSARIGQFALKINW
jgi:hypothetical protein